MAVPKNTSTAKNNKLIDVAGIRENALKTQTVLLNFSFKYLTEKGEKFKYTNKEGIYFHQLKERLRELSKYEINTFRNNYSKALRNHLIRFEKTSETSFAIPGEEQLITEPFQFSLSANEYGRVHGFILNNTFYVVWLDPFHELYPDEN